MSQAPTSAPTTPDACIAQFGRHVAARDLDALLQLYEPGAVFYPAPGVTLRGLDQIRGALAQMLSLDPLMEATVDEVHEVDGVALVIVDWRLRGTGPDGSSVVQQGRSADVLRRQPDGTWRVLIDHP